MDENTNATANETTNDVVQTTPKAETSKADDKPTTQSAEDTIQQQMVEIAKLKRALDKASSDVADYKKKYNATLSEQERASQEKAEEQARRDERLAELERENSIHKFTESYLDLGYDKESAIAAATASYKSPPKKTAKPPAATIPPITEIILEYGTEVFISLNFLSTS